MMENWENQCKTVRRALWAENERLRKDLDDAKLALAERNELTDRLRAIREKLENENKALKLAMDAAKYAGDRLKERVQELTEENRQLRADWTARNEAAQKDAARMWALQDQLERMQERAGYPVDVDPVIADKLVEDNKLLREEIKAKEVWISDILQRTKEFRTEIRELNETAAKRDAEAAVLREALTVILETADKTLGWEENTCI